LCSDCGWHVPGWVAVRQKQLTLPSSPYIHIVVVRIVLYPINSCLVDRRACPVQFSSLCVAGHCRRLAFFLFLFSCSFDISQPLLSSSIYNPPQTLTHESSSTIAYTLLYFLRGVLCFSYRLRRPPPHHGGGDKIRFHARQNPRYNREPPHMSAGPFQSCLILYRVLCLFVLSFFFFTSPFF
jgi:hypothetical protein